MEANGKHRALDQLT